MASISGCAKADEADLVGHLTPVIRVGDEEDTVVELIEWPRLKGSRVEYSTGSSWFREFCKAKSSIDGIWGHAFAYRGNFFKTCSVSQGGDYLYLLPDLAKEKKCRHLGDEFDYGLTLPLSNLAKSVMNLIGACPAQLNYNFWEVILVCETLNGKWAAFGSEKRITAKDFLEYYAVKYVTATDGAYLSSSSSRLCFFDLSSAGLVWNDNLLWASGECFKRYYEEPLELNNRTITKGINCKVSRMESFIDVVAREGTELEAFLKELEISRFKRVASKDDKVRRSQAKRRLVGKTPGSMEEKLSTPEHNTPLKLARLNEIPDGPVDMATISSTVEVLEESDKIAEGADLRPRFEAKAGLLEEQCRAKVREKMVAIMDDEFKRLKGEKNQLEDNLIWERGAFQLEREKEREAAALKLKEVRAKSEAEAERLVTALAISRNNLAGKLYQLRYIKAEKMAFSEGNYEEMGIMDEEEVEEREDGLNVAKKTTADNQETINQYEDRLDVNVKLSLKLEEAKRQVEQKIAIILSRDLALNQLTNKLVELKEKASSGSRHEAELAEYRIRPLNEEISDMKCNIRALNEQLLKREIELDTTRTNLAVSEANFEKLNRVKADLCRLKGSKTQSRADLAEIQAKNKSLVDDLAHARRNRELRVREIKYQKDLKFELDKRDGEIASGEGSREIKEFLRRKEELVENMFIDLTNSWQKSIDLTRYMSERIDQLTAKLAESKARRLKDNKRATVTHQAFKEIVVHEQEKCDGEALHQRQLSALVTFFVEEIKFLQVERDLMQVCFSGRTCVCKLDISSINPIGVMDRGIGITTAEQIARGRKIVVERAPEYMASRTDLGEA
ncbi:hypothetical protein GIB67_002164 [Kingdonia uniflora]|uniref:Uncharacterized protein n=1 Tax=Kingdonia uniflora TaxID=39325 RepID=A0A7J7KWM0_9MAGN|nr:hypothetical protein GIB67_002164 [Kingdonia uniflora]